MSAFKDHFSPEEVGRIASIFSEFCPKFQAEKFTLDLLSPEWADFELKERIARIAHGIFAHSQCSFPEIAKSLVDSSQQLSGFSAWPLQTVIEFYGLENPELALDTMAEITEQASAEFAIRPFLEHHKEMTISKVLEWSEHVNHHTRRLASEGTRPKLPWGQNVSWISKHPDSFAQMLDKLSDDSSEYVRKSVANHANDITKIHKESALELTQKWFLGTENQQKVAKHALRWLLKKGDSKALQQVGFSDHQNLSLLSFEASSNEVVLGEKVTFLAILENNAPNNLTVDVMMRMEYPGKKSRRTSVFNWKRGEVLIGSNLLNFSFSFENRSIRVLNSGQFEFTMVVNGAEMGKVSVFLNPS